MKILELFAGYGSQKMALNRLGIEVESEISEIDKYAIQAYNQIHGETKNWGDITKIDENELPTDYDLITYSFCCQDLSQSGLQKGMEKGSGTRSALLWECERIIRHCKPKYLLLENVKALVSKKFMPYYEQWLQLLDEIGYNTYWQVLNAKDFGVPQNRERVFGVSIRKDVDDYTFKFPEKQLLTKRLKDILEPKVSEKYYLSQHIIDRFKFSDKFGENCIGTTKPEFRSIGQRDIVFNPEKIMGALVATDYKQPKQIFEPFVCASRGRNPDNPSDRTTGCPTEQRLEPNSQGISNTLTTVQKDNYVCEPIKLNEDVVGINIFHNSIIKNIAPTQTAQCGSTTSSAAVLVIEPKIEVMGNYKPSGYECGGVMNVDGISPTIKENHGSVCSISENTDKVIQLGNIAEEKNFKNPQSGRIYSQDGCSPTLNTCGGGGHEPKIINDFRIRKLTPKECLRLMDVLDEDIDKLYGISDTQRYKLAGNSIVVSCMVGIFKNLLKIEN